MPKKIKQMLHNTSGQGNRIAQNCLKKILIKYEKNIKEKRFRNTIKTESISRGRGDNSIVKNVKL